MRYLLGTALLAASALLATPGAAQAPLTARGELRLCDCRFGDHLFTLEGGRRYQISASAEDFDSMIRVYRRGSTEEPLAQDDDSGGEMNPQLTFTPPESGEYLVRVVSFNAEGAGAYTVNVTPLEPLPAVITRATGSETTTWQVYDGELSQNDPVESEMRFDDYAIELEAGQTALIRLDSEAFDPVVRIFPAASRGTGEVAMDDDSGGGFNSFLMFAPDEGGSFIVRVTSFSTEGTGAYRLRISR